MTSIAQIRKKHKIESIEISPNMKDALVHVHYSATCPECNGPDGLGNSIYSTAEIRECRCFNHGHFSVRRAFWVSAKAVKGLI